MRRSEWRRRADDPTTLLGWWWWGVFKAGWPFYILLIPISFALVWNHPYFVMLPTGAVILANRLRRKWMPDLLGPMLPQPAPTGQFRARVEYRRKGIVTGRDEMALVVVDGWLYAEGIRSHFAVRREDVRDMGTGSDRKGWFHLTDGSEIYLSDIGDPARIVLERWRYRPTLIEGEPTFPPARVHSQEVARWAAWIVAGMALIGLPNAVAALLHLGGRFAEIKIGVAFGGVGVFFFGGERLKNLILAQRDAKDRLDDFVNEASPLHVKSSPRFHEKDDADGSFPKNVAPPSSADLEKSFLERVSARERRL